MTQMTSATPKPRAGEHTKGPWQWYWREESIDGVKRADCGIFHEKHLGHAYSVCRAPQYAKQDEWEANARRIVACVNACEGYPTEGLEMAIPGSFFTATDTIAERDSLREREKELVEALKESLQRWQDWNDMQEDAEVREQDRQRLAQIRARFL